MFFPRTLFLLPHLLLLLAAAVNSAPVPETSCPSCVDLPRPRTLEARFEINDGVVQALDQMRAQAIAELQASIAHWQNMGNTAQTIMQNMKNALGDREFSTAEYSTYTEWKDQRDHAAEMVAEIQQQLAALGH